MSVKGCEWEKFKFVMNGRVIEKNDGDKVKTGVLLYPRARNYANKSEDAWEVQWDEGEEREVMLFKDLEDLVVDRFAEDDFVHKDIRELQKNNWEPIAVPVESKKKASGKEKVAEEPPPSAKNGEGSSKSSGEAEAAEKVAEKPSTASPSRKRKKPAAALEPAAAAADEDTDFIRGPTGRRYPRSVVEVEGDLPVGTVDEADGDFEVSCIVDEAIVKSRGKVFLVKWKGYALDVGDLGKKHGHWEPEKNLKHCAPYQKWKKQKPEWFTEVPAASK